MTTSNTDMPPAYNSLHTSTADIAVAEETAPICEDDDKILVSDSFEDKTTRLAFIQKVLAIKLLQLLGVVMVMTYFALDTWNRGVVMDFLYRNYVHVSVLSTLAFVAILGLLIYCDQARRTNPYRYMFLVAYPLSYTLLICFTMIWWRILEIVAAWYYYCFAVFALLIYSIFANRTKLDFTTRYAILIYSLVLIGMFAITFPMLLIVRNVFNIVYATIAVWVDLLFLLFNLEVMTYKNYRTNITPGDFVDAAINLHVDLYYIFINFTVPKVKIGFAIVFK